MARFTVLVDGVYYAKNADGTIMSGDLIDSLGAYEDTGLEPAEIAVMKSREQWEPLMQITQVCGVTLNRLLELAEADKDGVCVVLDDKTELAMLAGAYAIKNSRCYNLATFFHNFRSDNPQKISFSEAGDILYNLADAHSTCEAAAALGKEQEG